MKDCGGCRYFLKIKGNWGNSGICTWFDARTDEDRGKKCRVFKAPKYDRSKSQ